jgi:rare lipoprotein A (peptidoglycan hydrolase)
MSRPVERATAIATTALALALIATLLNRPEQAPPAPEPTATPTAEPTATPTTEPSAPAWQLQGIATWYDATKNNAWFTQQPRPGAAKRNQDGAPYPYYAAAGPSLRALAPFKWGKEPYAVKITNTRTGRSIIAWVVDTCSCYGKKADPNDDRVVDLSPAAFTALGVPLGRGIQAVTVEPAP